MSCNDSDGRCTKRQKQAAAVEAQIASEIPAEAEDPCMAYLDSFGNACESRSGSVTYNLPIDMAHIEYKNGNLYNYAGNRIALWSQERKSKYMLKVFQGEANLIFFVRRRMGTPIIEIGDGNNRMTAVIEFMDNRLPIWVPQLILKKIKLPPAKEVDGDRDEEEADESDDEDDEQQEYTETDGEEGVDYKIVEVKEEPKPFFFKNLQKDIQARISRVSFCMNTCYNVEDDTFDAMINYFNVGTAMKA